MNISSVTSNPFQSSIQRNIPEDLDHLKYLDIETVERLIEQSSSTELWNHFLKGQARLFFGNYDEKWLSEQSWWQSAQNVLEIGSGNGCYLSLIQSHFPEKIVEGVDYNSEYVEQASREYPHISFCQGNAEEELLKAEECYDVVILRYTLSWLKDPMRALESAQRYLKPGGKILLIDANSRASVRSNEIPSLAYTTSALSERSDPARKAHRDIAMNIFTTLQSNSNSSLSNLYKVHSSNVDLEGNRQEGLLFTSREDLDRYLNQNLLWFGIMKKQHGINVDLPTARQELELYKTEGFETAPGTQYLVLEKK